MRAVRYNEHGLPHTLSIETLPDLHPDAGEIVIDVKAASVNFPDVLTIQNKYQFKPPLPFTPGAEFAGIVREVAPDVTRFKPGMRVTAYTAQGAFAEQAHASEAACIPLLDDVDFADAAAFTLAYGTAYHALVDRGQGWRHAAGARRGGRRRACVDPDRQDRRRARDRGGVERGEARVLPAARRGRRHRLRARGFARAQRIKALTDGRGPDVILDPVGGAYAEPAFRSIVWHGRYLVVGFANGEIELPLNLALLKGASIVGVFWGDHMRREHALAERDFATMIEWITAGKLRPVVTKRYALDDTPQALDDMMNRA